MTEKTYLRWLLVLTLGVSHGALAVDSQVRLGERLLLIAPEWQILQQLRWQGISAARLQRGEELITLVAANQAVEPDTLSEELEGFSEGEFVYYGYSNLPRRSELVADIWRNSRRLRSITDDSYHGRKFYLGWGAAAGGDPSMMHNEVKYDVKHTHDVFVSPLGGDYLGKTLIGAQVTGSQIQSEWRKLSYKMTAEDMYLQYSSGHGSNSGLAVGLNWNQIRDNALGYPAREIVLFTMACRSGNLVEAFNAKRSTWANWQQQGRTLFVMASSLAGEDSSTGPGTDPQEPGGAKGTAGSAFGHALWKAITGQADGSLDGVKDGLLSLGEIEKFTIQKTKSVGGHTPVVTGSYDARTIFAKVPPRSLVESLEEEGGSSRLTEEEMARRLWQLPDSQ